VKFLLASASPRRADLLRQAGYAFDVVPADVDEEQYADRFPPRELASFLARTKAREVAGRFPDRVVLAADTVVALGDRSLGKPADDAEAREMIALLSDQTHEVITGVVVCRPGLELTKSAVSTVSMVHLSRTEIEAYVVSGRWRGKAGGYGIQDAAPIVTCLGGSVSNVMGLPMDETVSLLGQGGVTPVRSDNDSGGRGPGRDV
jgi:septum formation protein